MDVQLAIWLGLLGALATFAIGSPRTASPLTLSYFLGLSLIHVPGVLPFLYGQPGPADFERTRVGFELTIIGMSAFVCGAIAARALFQPRAPGTAHEVAPTTTLAFERLGWRASWIGVGAYFGLVPLAATLPSATSIVSSLATLLILGLWMVLYGASRSGDHRAVFMVIAVLPILPLSTLVLGGFLGYGIYWVISVVAFFVVLLHKRILVYLAAPIVIFIGLSVFVTYIGQRDALREMIWYEQSTIFDRVARVFNLFADFEHLDLSNPAHVAALEGRLNQNELVGAAVEAHDSGVYDYALGGTVPFWALIPRAVWPDKPEVGGSGSLVSTFTGIEFGRGTSVGIGQVMEFYVNFGPSGVLLGFGGLGLLLMQLDREIMRGLASGDIRRVLPSAMPGLGLLQPGGSLLEILVTVVSAVLVSRLLLAAGVFAPRLRGIGGYAARPSAR